MSWLTELFGRDDASIRRWYCSGIRKTGLNIQYTGMLDSKWTPPIYIHGNTGINQWNVPGIVCESDRMILNIDKVNIAFASSLETADGKLSESYDPGHNLIISYVVSETMHGIEQFTATTLFNLNYERQQLMEKYGDGVSVLKKLILASDFSKYIDRDSRQYLSRKIPGNNHFRRALSNAVNL